jgi:hypothetical protein
MRARSNWGKCKAHAMINWGRCKAELRSATKCWSMPSAIVAVKRASRLAPGRSNRGALGMTGTRFAKSPLIGRAAARPQLLDHRLRRWPFQRDESAS